VNDAPKLALAPVTVLPVITTLDINVERVLNAALDAKLGQVVIIGRDADGDFYFASSKSDGGDVLWDLETARLKLMGAP
jgi:hypothetical protein